ncbi:MAG: histidinol phosphate phosphatase domain-containing protein [Candidatus Omnitrophica bacterium]|nr:histidinol phosphate phosphatase domain-containing protein [Candidatus Omnitrophota bacterium]
MIDLHTHSLLSDGVLLPSELARRAEEKGYRVIGITDHTDASNLDFVTSAILRACKDINKNWQIKAIPGVELTHMPVESLKPAVRLARSKGIRLVLIHGETLSEPVIPGTNRAALLAGPAILAHPGLISIEDAKLAASKGIYLEITARSGHSLTNGHVAKTARIAGAGLVLNSDSHEPGNLISREFAEKILLGAGLDRKEASQVFKNSEKLACQLLDIKKLV